MGRVCNRTPDLRYYLCMYLVDMRKQFNGLQGIVTQEFGRYITCNNGHRNFPPAYSDEKQWYHKKKSCAHPT